MASKRPSRRAAHRTRSISSSKKPVRRFRPIPEAFEPRLLLSTIWEVNALTDTGSGAGNQGDLRYCITEANEFPGSTIDITATGTDTLTGSLPALSADTTITDSDPGSFIVASGGDTTDFNALTINSGVTATISGVNFTNFNSSGNGGILDVEGSLTLDDSDLGDSSAGNGGAVYVGLEGVLDANQTIFHDNSAANGGAILNENSVTLDGGSVQNNSATADGGGILSEGYLYVDGEELYGNTANTDGGAIYYTAGMGTVPSYLLVADSTIDGNTATTDGGGIMSYYSAKLRDDTIANNTSGSGATGAGFYNANPTVTPGFYNSIVAQNMADSVEDDIDGVDGLYAASSYNLIGDTALGGITDGSQGNQIGTSESPLQAGLAALADNGGDSDTLALDPGSPALGAGLISNADDLVTGDPLPYDQRGVGFPRVVNDLIDIGAFQTQVATTSLAVGAASGVYGGTTTLTATLTSGGDPVPGELVDIILGSSDLGTMTTDVNGVATFSNVSLGAFNVGSYTGAISASFAGDSGFGTSSNSANLTVTAAPLTISVGSQTQVYGAALPTLSAASYIGLVNGDTPASLTTAPTLTPVTITGLHVTGSPYVLNASGAVDSNYTISYVAGTLAVTAAPLTITVGSQTKVYGAALPTLSAASYIGLVNGDTPASLTTAPTLTPVTTTGLHVSGSPYVLNASAAVDPDYTISYVAGTLAITAAPLTITVGSQTQVYGAALPTLSAASYTGLVNGDTPASLTTAPTLTPVTTTGLHVSGSPYVLNASAAVDPDYTISYVAGTLAVTAAPLTITVGSQTQVYGAALPTLSAASYIGLVNGDTPASLTTAPTLTPVTITGLHVTGSPYVLNASGAVDSNYTISYVAGTLAVTAAPLTITVGSQTKVYGAALPTLSAASYIGLVNGDTPASLTTAPTLTPVTTTGLHVSGSPYVLNASAAVDPDYTISYVAGTLAITAAPLTITVGSQTQVYGAALPTLSAASYTGLVNGDTPASLTTAPTLTPITTTGLHVSGSPYVLNASGAVDTDYTISYVAGTLAVTAAPLTISVGSQTQVYGAALPTLSAASYTGLVNGDTPASLTTAPTLTPVTITGLHVSGSPYVLNASAAVDPDYTISYVAGTLSVTAAPLTITVGSQTQVYGAALPTLSAASYTGFVNGDTPASLTTAPTLTPVTETGLHVSGSPYILNASGAVDPDYTISYVAGTLAVTAAPLTITVGSQTQVYGAALPTLSAASYIGLVNGDTPASLTTAPTLTPVTITGLHVSGSPYVLNASGAVDPDYTISYVAGTLAVTAAPLTISVGSQTQVYGAALPTLSAASYTGLVNGDTPASLTTAPTLTPVTTTGLHVSGSPYVLNASAAVDPDYTISYVAGTLSVTAAPLTISVGSQTKVYGAALPTLSAASYIGLVNGDTPASLTTAPTLTPVTITGLHVTGSPYVLNASGAVDPDYTISYVAGTLAVTAAPLTITADNQTTVYGSALPTLAASYTGFVNGDTSANLNTLPTVSTSATTFSDVSGSPYVLTASGAVDPDYAISYVAGSLTVTQAPLTVVIANQSKVYGQANPTLTGTVTGVLNGDDVTASYATTAGQFSDVQTGGYAITLSDLTGAKAGDYSTTVVGGSETDGVLTVTPAPLTVVVANQSKVYGQANPALTGVVTGVLNGDDVTAVYTTTATASSDVVNGGYAITVSGLSGANVGNYSVGTATPGTLTVTPAPLSITANNAAKVYGQANPAFTASYSGFVLGQGPGVLSGTLGFTTPATAASHVGNYAITPSGLTATDYAIDDIAGSVAVTPASLTITAVNIINSYGQPIPTLTADYSGFVNGDSAASLTTPVNLTTPATIASHVNVYPISASGATSGDYSISFVNGAIAIIPANLYVTPVNVINAYGFAIPSLTATYSGFLNGDTAASLTSPVTLSTAAVAGSPVGVYPIAASGGASADYTINYGPGAVAIVTNPGQVAFVNSLYQSILGRDPETFGLDFWLLSLADGTSESDVASQIYNSTEGKAARAQHKVPFITEQAAYQKALVAQAQAENPTA